MEFWITFKFLTRVFQDDQRLKSQVGNNFSIIIAKDDAIKNLKQLAE